MEEERTSKEKILKTAFELFVERSYENVSLEEIARKSDYSKGAIFHHFDSKYDLARESLVDHFEALIKSSFEEIEGSDNAEEKLDKTIELSFELFIEEPKLTRFTLEIYELGVMREDEEKELEIVQIFSQFIKETEDLFKELGVPNQKARSHLLWAVMDGIALQYYLWEDDPDFPDKEDLQEEIHLMFSNRYKHKLEEGGND